MKVKTVIGPNGKERIKVNRITSPGMPGNYVMVLTYYKVCDIISQRKEEKSYV